MKSPLFYGSIRVLLAAALPFTSITIQAESRCPGNFAGESPRMVAGALLVIPVRINHSGPYDFMVDTGSQLNVIDPLLATELALKSQGRISARTTLGSKIER